MKISDNINGTPEPDDTSSYIWDEEQHNHTDLGNLSDRFTNIRKIYSSATNPTVLYSAMKFGKRYILKGISTDFRTDPIQNIALSKEFEIGISLDHPNIRRTISYEMIEDLGKVIVLEYVDGTSLKELLESGNILPEIARQIVKQLASALEYIHRKQILHCDLKPSNILISHQGSYVKIIDFNLADSDSFMILKHPGGTQNYIAPELINKSASPSIASDIFSFGAIIKDLADATKDSALKRIATQCTSVDPQKRPHSVDAIQFPDPDSAKYKSASNILSSKKLTYWLCAACIILSAAIIYFINVKNLL
ncbi:MAG: serine/threonine protein kinase [Bacteroides sp.]|nr:serine/threonine protein kinase [Bacteroides sp.]